MADVIGSAIIAAVTGATVVGTTAAVVGRVQISAPSGTIMSALNVFIRPDAASIVSDGLAVTGAQRTPFSKIAAFPHLRAAVVSRGRAQIIGGIDLFIKYTRPSFEAAARAFADDVRHVQAHLRPTFEGSVDVQAAHIGWPDEGDVPTGLFVNSTAGEPFAASPFQGVVTPSVEKAGFETRADAVALIAAQRAAYTDNVGGFVDLTTIRRERITSETLHQWQEDFTA